MENVFCIDSISIDSTNLLCTYSVIGDWKKYFTDERRFKVEYTVDISGVPESIAVLPLLCNILPVAWVMNATIKVPYVDAAFYKYLENIKDGYKNMYPQLKFRGGY